jgi:hypothetical protein
VIAKRVVNGRDRRKLLYDSRRDENILARRMVVIYHIAAKKNEIGLDLADLFYKHWMLASVQVGEKDESYGRGDLVTFDDVFPHNRMIRIYPDSND